MHISPSKVQKSRMNEFYLFLALYLEYYISHTFFFIRPINLKEKLVMCTDYICEYK